MTQVALIACSKRKTAVDGLVAAEHLYKGDLFVAQLEYARYVLELWDDAIFILSAKHGLLRLSDKVRYYNKVLSDLDKQARMEWGERVTKRLLNYDLGLTTAYILAGKTYQEPLANSFKRVGIEMVIPQPPGLGYGQQVKWYRDQLG